MENQTSFAWPELDYQQFKSTSHLLHMGTQAIGKLKLYTPFEPHWANVALWLTSRGLTTGLIPFESKAFSIDLDMLEHKVIVSTTMGQSESFSLTSMSVAQFVEQLFLILKNLKITYSINLMPQEIENPVPFDKDTEQQFYNKELATTWWKILVKSYLVMQRYHARFDGESPAVGFMWGTFDLREARYNGVTVETTGINSGYIRRNAMNEAQVEVGWWPGNEAYPRPAFYAFIYPQPDHIENCKIQPKSAYWNEKLMEFVLDYDELRKSSDPEKDLLNFFESAYQAGSELAEWKPGFITTGKPT